MSARPTRCQRAPCCTIKSITASSGSPSRAMSIRPVRTASSSGPPRRERLVFELADLHPLVRFYTSSEGAPLSSANSLLGHRRRMCDGRHAG
jgi:hypothetical protein